MTRVTRSLRTLYDTMSRTLSIPGPERDACAMVRDVIDMEMIPDATLVDVALGRFNISTAMENAADVLAAAQDADLANGLDDAEFNTDLIDNMRTAAACLRG